MKILNFGSLNLDYVYSVDHMTMEGETQTSLGMSVSCGGKGLNQSIALAKAGAEVYHAGLIGEEGQVLAEACQKNGVHIEYIRRIPGKSGHTIIQLDQKGKNCILLYGGANRRMTESYMDEVLKDFGKSDILLLQNEINLLPYVIDRAYEKGMRIILNPSPCDEFLDGCDFGKISMLIMNEIEGWQITGEKEPKRILEILKERYPGMEVILTLGQEGSVYQREGVKYHQKIFPVHAVDTTAAGDTFTGYFIASRAQGLTVPRALELAAKAAAIAVTRSGAADSIPEKEEVRQREWQV